MDAGRETAALEQYRQAGTGAGNDVEAILKMADGLERMNRLQGARLLTRLGLESPLTMRGSSSSPPGSIAVRGRSGKASPGCSVLLPRRWT